jgi:hypothetical protein
MIVAGEPGYDGTAPGSFELAGTIHAYIEVQVLMNWK